MSQDTSLAKLTIKYEQKTTEDFKGKIEALFNPNQLAFSRSVSWKSEMAAVSAKEADFQKLRFASNELETLTISLFFDTYEGDPDTQPLGQSRAPTSVAQHTDAIASLARFNRELHRPPICELSWGRNHIFRGVLQSLKQTFTLFLKDGTPVRATADCTFQQYQTEEDRIQNQLHSADVAKRYTVLPGDTLASIAASTYQDASLWRKIADHNRLENPRRLTPGQVLSIPRIR